MGDLNHIYIYLPCIKMFMQGGVELGSRLLLMIISIGLVTKVPPKKMGEGLIIF